MFSTGWRTVLAAMAINGSISYCRYLSFIYYVNVVAFIVIASLTLSSSSTVEWDRRRASVRQGESISVTCTVPDLDLLSVVRVERRDDDKQTRMVLADNGDVKEPFAGNRRYRVNFNQRGSIGTTTVNYIQIRGEDAGTLACYKLATSVDETNVALLELKVLVPVQSVRLTKMSSSGNDQSLEDYDDNDDDLDSSSSRQNERVITLTELSFSSALVRPEGVACVASVNGSLMPPDVRLMIDSRDVTGQFIITEQSRIVEETETESNVGGASGRLGFYYGEKRMTYSTSLPDATWNGRTLTCVASQEGFPDTIAAARVVVNYIPQIACHSHDISIDLGKSFHLTCKVKSNPSPEVTWFFVDKNETIGNATNKANRLIKTSKSDGTEDEYEASMHLTDVTASHLGLYRLTASNTIGVGEETIEVRLRRPKPNIRDRENINRSRGQPITGGHSASSLSSADVITPSLLSAFFVVWSTAVNLMITSSSRTS